MFKLRPFVLAPFLASFLAAVPAAGGAQSIQFDGVATATCTLASTTPGTIALKSDLSSWATVTPGTITATNTAQSDLTVTRSGNWSVSPAGTPSTTFDHQLSITGSNNVGGSQIAESGNAKSVQLANLGANLVSVSVAASAPSPFPAGTYQTQVTVTCVPR